MPSATTMIAIVNDNDLTLTAFPRVIKAFLSDIAIWPFATAEEFVEAVKGGYRCHLVLMDNRFAFSEMQGPECVRAILRTWPQAKVVAFTINDSPAVRQAFKLSGAFGFIDASQSTDKIIAQLQHYLES